MKALRTRVGEEGRGRCVSTASMGMWIYSTCNEGISVADPHPNPDPSDLYVFGPLGSGSISQRNRSGAGSGSFYHQAKIVRNTFIPTAL
jgi:hypothetical protein